MKLYVKVSEDDLELPEAVAESPIELSRMLGYGRKKQRHETKGCRGRDRG